MAKVDFLAPDIFVNASVALGSPPEHIARRVLVPGKRIPSSVWVLERVEAMLSSIPEFKPDAVAQQMSTIREFVDVVELSETYGAEQWREALVAAAKASKSDRVVTDHPDLLEVDEVDGVRFVSSDAWMVEATMPPPPPV